MGRMSGGLFRLFVNRVIIDTLEKRNGGVGG